MPTYDYECESCGHGFEVYQAINDAKLKECPQCHKKTLQRLIGAGSGLIFKGSGFYETDYKRKAGTPSCPAEKSSACPCPCDKAKSS